MSKMSQISAEMDEMNIPLEERNGALFKKVSEGLMAAEKKIDNPTPTSAVKKPQTKMTRSELVRLVKEYATTTHSVVNSNGKNYVKHSVWQFIASCVGLVPSFSFDDENISTEGYTVACTCKLFDRSGREVSQTTMVASVNEDFLSEKDSYAVWGMAQTRALSRAVKNIYGYIVEEAGFTSTPIEEIEFNK